MSHVRWEPEVSIDRPFVIAAFEGWNDAGDAATIAARWLRDRFAPEPLAEIDPEEFFDFTARRPEVRLVDGVTRQIDWPMTTITASGPDSDGPPMVVVLGTEPHLRWRTYCQAVVSIVERLDARLVLTLGSLLAEVPHTRPSSVIGTAADEDLIERLDLRRSQYEGPTGIVGVLQDACGRAGRSSASLWATVPAYVPGAPSPKAALALVERAAGVLEVPIMATDLEIAAASYERQVSEVVVEDEDMTRYVERLETRYASEEVGADLDEGGFIEAVERFLREQRSD